MSLRLLISFFLCTVPATTYDFVDYWTVKVNGNTVFDSSKENKSNSIFTYSVLKSELRVQDSIEVEYFTDTPCPDCIYHYFISEYSHKDGMPYQTLNTFYREAKSLGPRVYKISLLEVAKTGTENSIKAIYYYQESRTSPKELCRVYVK
ncbi:MAG: hypothetical protein JST02_05120 [Bacteroidetes bacterium]|nr:hypothetical protein [Bacteroidota bacterium]